MKFEPTYYIYDWHRSDGFWRGKAVAENIFEARTIFEAHVKKNPSVASRLVCYERIFNGYELIDTTEKTPHPDYKQGGVR